MPSRPDAIRAYVEGRKFQKLKAAKDFDFERLQPYIIPSQKRRRQLFCTLTKRYINRKPTEVDLHLRGKRYTCALEKYNAGQVSLFEEKLGKKGRYRNEEVEDMEIDVRDGVREEVELSDQTEDDLSLHQEASHSVSTARAAWPRKRRSVIHSPQHKIKCLKHQTSIKSLTG